MDARIVFVSGGYSSAGSFIWRTGRNNGERKPEFFRISIHFCVTHAASLCLVQVVPQILWHRGERLSLNRFTKFSSARSLLNALTIKTSFSSLKPGFGVSANFCFLAFAPVSIHKISALVSFSVRRGRRHPVVCRRTVR